MNNEVDLFKTDINLSEYAASKGYELDKTESSRNSVVMRSSLSEDKIIITRGQDNHWTYFSVGDTGDNGSIIDFIQNRERLNLGEVRKELRPWIAERSIPTPINEYRKKIEPIVKNREGVIASFSKANSIQESKYLQSRGLRLETIQNQRFNSMIKQDGRGNTIFPHYDHQGLSGYELKNNNFTGFARGGLKSVWHSQAKKTDTRLVLVESAIDALSYHQLKGDLNTRYISTAGQLSDHQKNIIKSAIEKMPRDSVIVSAFDNDMAGHKFSKEIESLTPEIKIQRDVPKLGKDWNDQLKKLERDYIQKLGLSLGVGIAR